MILKKIRPFGLKGHGFRGTVLQLQEFKKYKKLNLFLHVADLAVLYVGFLSDQAFPIDISLLAKIPESNA